MYGFPYPQREPTGWRCSRRPSRALRALFDGGTWPGGTHVPALTGPLLPPGSPAAVGGRAIGRRARGRGARSPTRGTAGGTTSRGSPPTRRDSASSRTAAPSRRRGAGIALVGEDAADLERLLAARAAKGMSTDGRLDGHGRRAARVRRRARRGGRDLVRRAAGRAARPARRHRRGADRAMSGADLKRAKRAVRRRVLARARRDAPRPTARERSARIAERVLSLPEVERASTVMAFWSFGSEPDTMPLIEALHARGVRIALPSIVDGDLEPRTYAPGDPVTETSFGACEPVGRRGARPGDDRRRRHAGGGVRPVGTARRLRRRVLRPVLPERTRDDAPRIGIGFDVQLVDDDLPSGHFDLRRRRGRHRVGRRADRSVPDEGGRTVARSSADARGGTPSSRRSTSRRRGWTSRATSSCRSAWSRCAADGSCSPRRVHQLVDPDVPPSVPSQKIHELRPQDLAGAPRLEQARHALRDAIRGRYLLVWYADVEVNFLSTIFGGSAAPVAPPDDRRPEPGDRGRRGTVRRRAATAATG